MEIDAAASGAVLKRERVRDAVLELIEDRRPGDAIPSERTLCAELGVSRPTLRAAIDELVVAGLLVREHGRGMFVAAEKITQELLSDRRAFSLPQAAGAWTSRLLEVRTLPRRPGGAQAAHVAGGADPLRGTSSTGRRLAHGHRVPARTGRPRLGPDQ